MRARRTKPRLRKVYLLPNLFTAFNLFLGLYAIMNVLNGDFDRACWSIFIAGLLDGLDGMVARLTHTQSSFGLQFDSLSDLVSFGVAPSMAMYSLMQSYFTQSPHDRIAIGVCSLYAICGALRLARYNVQAHGEERKNFVGLPIPGAAALMIFTILFLLQYRGAIDTLTIPLPTGTMLDVSVIVAFLLPVIVLATALLMVSEVSYPSILKKIRVHGRMPFDSLVSIIFVIILIIALSSDLRVLLLFCMTFGYIFYGLINAIYQHFLGREPENHSAGSAEKPPQQPSSEPHK